MNKIPFKAIAVDMDGTFENDDLTYDHERFARVLKKIKENHLHFIVANGRSTARLKRDFKNFLNEIDIITSNGALLLQDNRVIVSHYLTYQTGVDLIAYIEENFPPVHIAVSGKERAYLKQSDPTDFKRLMHFYYPNAVQIPDLRKIPESDRIVMLTLNSPAEWAAKIENGFNSTHPERINCTTSGFDDIDVVPYGINKAKAVKFFLRHFHLQPSQLIAFGDGLNDKEMLSLAGYSYAMANSNPAILKLAKYKAPSNNDSGVLKILEDYLH